MKRRKVIVVLLMCALINQILVGVGHVLDKDFEGDSLSPWKEESAGGNRWEIEDFRHPFETNNAAPRKNDGSKYLRLRRASDGLFGVAQLRSPVFIAHPGDRISFSYWIRSRFNNFNSLQVILRLNVYYIRQSYGNLFNRFSGRPAAVDRNNF